MDVVLTPVSTEGTRWNLTDRLRRQLGTVEKGDGFRIVPGPTALRYEIDLTDAEWAVISPLMPAPAPCGRPSIWTTREIVSAIFYVLRRGIAWRLIPKDLPPRSTAYGYFSRWRDEGLFGRINHHPVMVDRERVDQEASPFCCRSRQEDASRQP